MADATSQPSYLKHAFKDQHNLVLLFGAGCFSLAFASRLPLLVGASGELLWLVLGPHLPAFRAWVDRQLATEYLARAERAIETALSELPESDVNRFRILSHDAEELLNFAGQQLTARERQLSAHALLELRRTFLDYLFLGQRVALSLDPTPAADLEREALQLQEAYSAERELTARMMIRQTLNSVQKRISQRTEFANVEQGVQVRLGMLERIPSNLAGRMRDGSSTALAQELDAALAEVGSVEPLELTVDAILVHSGPSDASRALGAVAGP